MHTSSGKISKKWTEKVTTTINYIECCCFAGSSTKSNHVDIGLVEWDRRMKWRGTYSNLGVDGRKEHVWKFVLVFGDRSCHV